MTQEIYPAHDGHFSVMLNEVMAWLEPKTNGVYVDATFGGGGYSKAILAAADCNVWGIDRDPDAITRGQEIQKQFPSLHLLQGDFENIDSLLKSQEVTECDGIVLDLGVSSFQLDQADRGFSFRFDGPLDMRMSRTGKTAADLVNYLSETEIADILFHYGEERFSRRIAKAIVARRAESLFETTQDLASLIQRTIPTDKSKINPATRSFQGLRIAVNNELEQIHTALNAALNLLKLGGKLIVVSFHSLEDRIVKDIMNKAAGRVAKPSRHLPLSLSQSQDKVGFELLTSKPQRPSEQECYINARSRSARLRAIKRIT
ncbi:16S rRNA C1402 N4-methylase RsmH (RmsH) (PDB:1M6Y) [Commensalibacter communis]|uniref:16S rRNA (cytosine(1402)-N(4))-methyltransferase RsmH n=1 Tax=Commensalibacter communis TaxID=2972786 RepID=UPI0022FFABC1|nr:16S rRNA (cytosine(1402)-N(4))-methyltransferase RsmH [Commensalibacter communis]CAI3923416.1 16S rRNA C1402 N4-methylase RsmH (RmsH) (PDB:1M6Y) [Commensalibacter communis]CAI3923684.1 16S rRNA C1402 N4-methylase RsmH (RmsH) (PDB:1M6Y) [Commensalibacter communis]CAI3931249.1 16S rRNA C1402 N4-methylase RsmH (RmsH) (PDB:1M6Y) [Commensalibacter communis]